MNAPELMNTPKFWHDMEARFRQLEPASPYGLRVDWYSPEWDEGERWWVHGDKRTQRAFKHLAERAALALGHLEKQSAVSFWLDLLKEDGATMKFYDHSRASNGEWLRSQTGELAGACTVSADYCMKLQNEAARKELVKASARSTHAMLDAKRDRDEADEKRDAIIFAAIKEGLKGRDYCSFLDERDCSPSPVWLRRWPENYCTAHYKSKEWARRIAKEKNRFKDRMKRLSSDELERILGLLPPIQKSL